MTIDVGAIFTGRSSRPKEEVRDLGGLCYF
jgi:hypothetical protein